MHCVREGGRERETERGLRLSVKKDCANFVLDLPLIVDSFIKQTGTATSSFWVAAHFWCGRGSAWSTRGARVDGVAVGVACEQTYG